MKAAPLIYTVGCLSCSCWQVYQAFSKDEGAAKVREMDEEEVKHRQQTVLSQ